jgi:hypothetical protein
MRAAEGRSDGSPVDVMSAPLITDVQIGQMRGRIMAQLRRAGWSYVAIGKMFRCTDRWVRAELKDLPTGEKRRRIVEDDSDVEDSQLSLAI